MTTITFNGMDDSEYILYEKLVYQCSVPVFEDEKEELERLWNEIVGSDYEKEPLPTLEQIQKEAKRRASILDNYYGMRAPDFAIEARQKDLEEVLLRIQRKEYVLTNAEMKYRKEYYSRRNKYYLLCYTAETKIVK